MKSVQIKNLRSLRDTGQIEVRKINLLVGNNSSGKSTFLRVFPLLKQSINKRINGPILWCGDDDDYVDFGSFKEALNNSTDEKSIRLQFEFNVNINSQRHYLGNDDYYCDIKIEFAIMHKKDSEYDYISECVISYLGHEIQSFFSEEEKIIRLNFDSEETRISATHKNFFPLRYDTPLFGLSFLEVQMMARQYLEKIILVKNETADIAEKVYSLNSYIFYLYKRIVLNERQENTSTKLKSSNIFEVPKMYLVDKKEELKKWLILYYLQDVFEHVSDYIKLYFNNVYYMAPVRATAERYYRLRNAAVNEVDCRGKNLPVFLNSLENKNFSQFQRWTRDNLGFEVVKAASEGHVSLKIKKVGQSKTVNLSDTGFGYSQILPIVTQLWYIAVQNKNVDDMIWAYKGNNIPRTIVIEQPELHLHPALQAKLMDIIVKVANAGNVNFIIETHSETMINRVGNLIDNGKINSEDVGIAIFEKEFGSEDTFVRIGGFDKDGYLENWPMGFFEPEEI